MLELLDSRYVQSQREQQKVWDIKLYKKLKIKNNNTNNTNA